MLGVLTDLALKLTILDDLVRTQPARVECTMGKQVFDLRFEVTL